MNQLRRVGGNRAYGSTGVQSAFHASHFWQLHIDPFHKAIESFSNGILMDSRCFFINDPAFIDKYNRQCRYEGSSSISCGFSCVFFTLVMFEESVIHAWQSGRAEEIMKEAPIRLQKEGWKSVRQAISLSVR
jgi:hypothetical protein